MERGNATATAEFLAHTRAVEEAVHKAVAEALRRHKRMGNPVCAWHEDHVVWIPPEEISIPEE